MPSTALTESGIQRAITELDQARCELRTELAAMKHRRTRGARPLEVRRDARREARASAALHEEDS